MKKVLTLFLIFFSVALSIIALAAPSDRATLKGSKPDWAVPKNYVDAAASADKLGFRVYLGWINAAGAEALACPVSNPRSKSYPHYLTPSLFRQYFAPTVNQAATVPYPLTTP